MEKIKSLKFGTSGLRALVTEMTDMECYINARGFIKFLKDPVVNEINMTNDASRPAIALAGDLRSSTSRIVSAVAKAIEDEGCRVDFCGEVPSPALTLYSIEKKIPSIMVTGSHIPDDRNGIKFTKRTGEVLKSDEADILRNVIVAREEVSADRSLFTETGMFKEERKPPESGSEYEAVNGYIRRFLDVFSKDSLKGKRVVLYQHSAVGRDIVRKIFEGLGAEVIAIEKTDSFVPVDTEKISDKTHNILKRAAGEYNPFAVISTDGDSDRPLLSDENGSFLPGDKLGGLVSAFLDPDFAAIPISANDAVVSALTKKGIEVCQTRIGSPYVIKAMNDKLAKDPGTKVVSWESNGGFLTGSDWDVDGKILKALPTRDAVLPLIAALMLASEQGKSVSELIASELPGRYTNADVVDNTAPGLENYTAEMGKEIIKMFSPGEEVERVDFTDKGVMAGKVDLSPEAADRIKGIKERLSRYFSAEKGFSEITSINFTDGIRIVFASGDVAHLRPSGNAPEFRMYATSDTQERANEIVGKRIEIIAQIVAELQREGMPRSVGAQVEGECASRETSIDRVMAAVKNGRPVYVQPYKEPKVWGVEGIGEYWYGAEAGLKSSIAVSGKDTAPMADILDHLPGQILGEDVVKKFGRVLPLVKILTPKSRLSVQFHDTKNELWVITGIDESVAGFSAKIILGFSGIAVEKFGDKITEKYKIALEEYGKALNGLIGVLEGDIDARQVLEDKKDAVVAAELVADKVPVAAGALIAFKLVQAELNSFYGYRTVKVGDVIPVPSGTLHALGAGVEVVEPQIAGDTQSLEDGATYPVRYAFPDYPREGASKQLDVDRVSEMNTGLVEETAPLILDDTGFVKIERLPGKFEDKGLEVHRITIAGGSGRDVSAIKSFHNLVTIEGRAELIAGGEKYAIPTASPGGEMLIVPATAKSYKIEADEQAQIIDTFTPIES